MIPRSRTALAAVIAAAVAIVALSARDSMTAQAAPETASARIATEHGISAQRILDDIKYLTSDELAGRATGTPGCDEAAQYIAGVFEKAGLIPGGDDGSYLQAYDAVVGAAIGDGCELASFLGDVRRGYDLDVDFRPLSFSESASASGNVVFVGYGISAPRFGYDDYAGMDVKDKVVLVMRHEPAEEDENSPFDGASPTYYSDLKYKAINAREHGASALVLFTDPLNHEDVENDLLEFDSGAGKTSEGIPCVQITLAAARGLFKNAGLDVEDLQAGIDKSVKPHSIALEGVVLSVTMVISREAHRAFNVLGRLEGADPALEDHTIIVGAHYDHLGTRNGEIYRGADDNASGTAALLEMARVLSKMDPPPARSILFAAFSGEEIGLLGSSYLASKLIPGGGMDYAGMGASAASEDTTVAGGGDAGGTSDESAEASAGSGEAGGPMTSGGSVESAGYRPDAMVNMDMVGRLRERKLMVGGVGSSPIFRPMLEGLAEDYDFALDYSEGGYGPSDHNSFYARGVPVLFFFTGVHDDNHKPTDTWEKINADGEALVLSLAMDAVTALASREEPIAFQRAKGETAGPPGGERYGGYGKARLGIVPDFGGEEVEGVRISGASEGSPAEAAGLKGGDVMVSFDGRPVKSLEDLMYYLKDKKPGDPVIIIVRRDGNEVTLKAVLGARTGRGHQ
jgi:membrane-associated protease RseP (regulator of RpoE activity)